MKSWLTKHFPLSWAEGPPNDDGRTGGAGTPPQQACEMAVVLEALGPQGPTCSAPPAPNKPFLFGVTSDAVPTGSHTSPNPAKICAKLNQSILEMALVRFCQRDSLQGDREIRRSPRNVGAGGMSLSTSKPPTASGGGLPSLSLL